MKGGLHSIEHEIMVMPFVSIINHHPQRRATPTHTHVYVSALSKGRMGGEQREKNCSHVVTTKGH